MHKQWIKPVHKWTTDLAASWEVVVVMEKASPVLVLIVGFDFALAVSEELVLQMMEAAFDMAWKLMMM